MKSSPNSCASGAPLAFLIARTPASKARATASPSLPRSALTGPSPWAPSIRAQNSSSGIVAPPSFSPALVKWPLAIPVLLFAVTFATLSGRFWYLFADTMHSPFSERYIRTVGSTPVMKTHSRRPNFFPSSSSGFVMYRCSSAGFFADRRAMCSSACLCGTRVMPLPTCPFPLTIHHSGSTASRNHCRAPAVPPLWRSARASRSWAGSR